MLFIDSFPMDPRSDGTTDTTKDAVRPDASAVVRGHGTGLSQATGAAQPAPDSAARSLPRRLSETLSLSLAVTANIFGGGLFLGALYLAPTVMDRLLSLL